MDNEDERSILGAAGVDTEEEDEGAEGAMSFLSMYGASSQLQQKEREAANRTIEQPLKLNKNINTPVSGSPATQVDSEKYKSRPKSGDTVFRFKCKDGSAWEERAVVNKPVDFLVFPTTRYLKDLNFDYMFDVPSRDNEATDYIIRRKGMSILEWSREQERRSTYESSQDEGVFLGRVTSDGSDKLTPSSVLFEGPSNYFVDTTVKLDLTELEEYSLFPGQIAAIEGVGLFRTCVKVNQIHPPRPFDVEKLHSKLRLVDKLNVLIATGPFTPSDSLKFEPLKDLTEIILKDKPHVCVLIGPFVDATHKLLQNEDLGKTFNMMFEEEVKTLAEKTKDLNMLIFIISSFKDAQSHVLYPTPQYTIPSNLNLPNVIFLPDPAIFRVQDVVIGVTATDILLHLSRAELSQSSMGMDRMGRLARHIISQGNFYPLYPSDESVPLHVENNYEFGDFQETPHIMILPSDLRHFIKDVDGTVVVNPERITKGSSGGTYCRLLIDLSNANDGPNATTVADYCSGEIIKI